MKKLSEQLAQSIMTRAPKLYQDTYNHGNWAYGHGVILKGIQTLFEQTKNPAYLKYIEQNISPFVDEQGNIRTYKKEDYNLDHLNNGKLFFLLEKEMGEVKYQKAAQQLFQQLSKQPTTSEGAFWHKKVYPSQVWLDGLYMATPFLAEYACSKNNTELYEQAILQFKISYTHLLDEETGLLKHAWDESKEQFWADSKTGQSQNFWTRSMGWYVMALAGTYELLKEKTDVTILGEMLEKTLSSLLVYQDNKSGVWFQVTNLIDYPQNYLEASGSAMIVYALAKGINLGILKSIFWENSLRKAYLGLQRQFILRDADDLLNVNYTCQVAGLGGNTTRRDGSVAYYLSEPIVCNDHKGFGAMLLASLEVEKWLESRKL